MATTERDLSRWLNPIDVEAEATAADDGVFPLYLVYKKLVGEEPLTAEESAVLADYEAREEERERSRDLLGVVDLAEVMREGVTEPEMLVDGLLVKGEHHLWYGNKESAKTWLALWAAAWVIGKGGTVIWVDKEMGRKNMANRFKVLGVPAQAVEEKLVYCEFPTLDCSTDSVTYWKLMLAVNDPSLVVVDAQTEVLADANLNENSGTDIEKWMKPYITPARKMGCATLMLDHTGHNSDGRSVGSRHKGAAAKVELEFIKTSAFDEKKTGVVEVKRRKNTVAAAIADVQHFQIGGDGQGGFTLERLHVAPAVSDQKTAEDFERGERLVEEIRQRGATGVTVTQARNLVGGSKKTVERMLDDFVQSETYSIKAKDGSRANSVVYFWSEPEAE